MKHKNQAFTLIELLVVIVIIGILATITTATFSDSVEKVRFAKAQAFDNLVEKMIGGSMVGRWSFEQSTNDSSGHGNHGTASSPQYVDDDVKGYAIDLTNAGVVNFGRPAEFIGQPEFTLSFWIKPNSINNVTGYGFDNVIFGNEEYGPGVGVGSGFRAGIRGEDRRLELWTQQSGGSVNVLTPNAVEIGKWHHIVISYDGSTMYMYLDGVSADVSSGVYTPREPGIGGNICLNGCVGGVTFSRSYFDEVRWYNEGIDVSELR